MRIDLAISVFSSSPSTGKHVLRRRDLVTCKKKMRCRPSTYQQDLPPPTKIKTRERGVSACLSEESNVNVVVSSTGSRPHRLSGVAWKSRLSRNRLDLIWFGWAKIFSSGWCFWFLVVGRSAWRDGGYRVRGSPMVPGAAMALTSTTTALLLDVAPRLENRLFVKAEVALAARPPPPQAPGRGAR